MTYELAKELKDAGFLFHWVDGWNDDAKKMEFKSYPSLEILIGSCGYDLRSITYHSDGRVIAKSGARSKFPKRLFNGRTTVEAVARLWLGLNA